MTPTTMKLTVEKRGMVAFRCNISVGVVPLWVHTRFCERRGADWPAMVRGEEGKARRSVGSLNVKSSPGDLAISGVKETVRSPASSMTVTEPPKAPTGWEDVIGEDETGPDWAFVDRVRAGLSFGNRGERETSVNCTVQCCFFFWFQNSGFRV